VVAVLAGLTSVWIAALLLVLAALLIAWGQAPKRTEAFVERWRRCFLLESAERAGAKPSTLCIEDQLLMMLEYWREYRTYFHIGQARGISESAAYRNIKWCENTLAKNNAFRLPGRKAAVASQRAFDIILIDATETPIERPKKTKALLFGKKETAHIENLAGCRNIHAMHPLPLPR
jgi:Helix-turn-helix of DDE superfamily endonuclease